MRSYRGMAPRTAALTLLVDTVRPGIERMTLDDIHRARGTVYPSRQPFGWLLGRLDPSVGVTFGTAPAGDGHEIPLRIYRPRAIRDRDTDTPVIVWFHGGGWVLGNLVNYDAICGDLALGVGAVVVSVDYRMAPEHPAPIAASDCIDATRWLASQGAVLRADPTRLAVAGDSAGGNLAAVVAQALRDAGAPRVAAQVLIYPATDLTMSSPSIRQHPNAGVLTRAAIEAFVGHYCPPGTAVTDPVVSPLFGDCHDLPPALVQTADLDPIRDDGNRYAARLVEAGTPVVLTNYRGVPHGFASFPGCSRQGQAQRREMVRFLSRHLAAAASPRSGDPSPS